MFTSDELISKEIEEVSSSLLKISGGPNDVILFGQELIPLLTNLMNCEKTLSFSPYIIADGLVMFLWLLLKKYVVEQKEELKNAEGLKDLLLDMMYLMKVAVEKSK